MKPLVVPDLLLIAEVKGEVATWRGSLAMERTVLKGAMLIDGSGAAPVAGRAVVVERDRIAAVVAEADAPAGTTLRLDGLTLLPGLVNCHAHLCFGAEADPAAVMLMVKAGMARRRDPAATATAARLERDRPGRAWSGRRLWLAVTGEASRR
jgi:imidazolonepropionase-like amidohydrolase